MRQRPHDSAPPAPRSDRPAPPRSTSTSSASATTPERFLRAVDVDLAVSAGDASPAGRPRRVRRDARASSTRARAAAASPPRSCSTSSWSCARSRASRACAACCTSSSTACRPAGNRFVLTSRYTARTLRLLRDRSARFEVIHMPPLTAEDTLDMLGLAGGSLSVQGGPHEAEYVRAHRAGAGRRAPGLRARPRRRAGGDARAAAAATPSAPWPRCSRPTAGSPSSAASATSCACTARAATARSRPSSRSSPKKKG